jgi:NAD+ dependent glucose-6-phosphate dehydrogenase
MRVVITGAAGKIGREVVDELSKSHELRLIDCTPVPGRTSVIANLAKCHNRTKAGLIKTLLFGTPGWWDAFAGAEIVIHLAEDPSSEASWQRVLHNNIQATWNVLQAAVQHQVRRVIYASSSWAVKALELELAPACYLLDGPKIGSEAQPRPKNPYAIGKACAEITGRMFVDERKLDSFVAVRLGWYHPDPPKNEAYRKLGIGAQDLRSLFRRCVEADFSGFHVVYGVSAQPISPYDLSYTRRLLSWEPGDLPADPS